MYLICQSVERVKLFDVSFISDQVENKSQRRLPSSFSAFGSHGRLGGRECEKGRKCSGWQTFCLCSRRVNMEYFSNSMAFYPCSVS